MHNNKRNSKVVEFLDRTAENNALLWLPCIVILSVILGITFLHDKNKKVNASSTKNDCMCKNNAQEYRKKPFSFRVVSVMTVLALISSFLTNMDIFSTKVFADEGYDYYMYIANDIIYNRSNASNYYNHTAYTTANYYLYEYKTLPEIWEENLTEDFKNSVATWEGLNLILSPNDAMDKAIDAKGYYVDIILTMMNCNFESDSVVDVLNNKTVKSSVGVYNSFCKMYKEMYNDDLEAVLKSNENVLSEQTLNSIKNAAGKYLESNRLIASGKVAKGIFDVLEVSKTPEEYVSSFITYCNVYKTSLEWKECLQYMYDNCDKNNLPLCEALDTLIYVSENLENSVFQIWKDGILKVGSVAYDTCIDALIDLIVKDCSPFIKGMMIGKTLGKSLSNLLCGTDKTAESYHIIKAYNDIMKLFRDSYEKSKIRYMSNPTPANAKSYLNYVNMYIDVLKVGNDYGLDFAKILCTEGILNKILRSQSQYEHFVKYHDFCSEYLTQAQNTITTSWIFNLYYDYPELYEIYAPIILKDNKDLIELTRIEFEKKTVEWGIDDVEFNGASYEVFPKNATLNEVIIKSSDENIAKMDNYGNITVKNTGTCQFIATSAYNDDIYDILEVSVVEGHGADSIAMPDIITIIPSYDQDFTYKIENDEVIITGYKGSSCNVYIPERINGYPVTTIGSYAFSRNNLITDISFPNTLTTIENGGFANCSKLSAIILPKSITSIDKAFTGSSITSVFIPKSLQTAVEPFSNCNALDNVIFEDGTVCIVSNLFEDCNGIKSIILPDTITQINDNAFNNCKNLSYVDFSYIKSIGNNSFAFCKSLENAYFTDELVEIGESAFACSGLTHINIPNSVTDIGRKAFEKCTNAISISIGNGLESIGWSCFADCENVNELYVDSDLGKITPSGTGYIFSYKFGNNCKLIVGDSIKEITGGFANATMLDGITSVYIGKNVGNIESNGANNVLSIIHKYTNIDVDPENSYYEADGKALYRKTNDTLELLVVCDDIKEYTINNLTTCICNSAFSNCKELESIIIPQNVSSIEQKAFCECTKLKKLTVLGNLNTIDMDAFQECSNLEEVVVSGKIIEIKPYAFYKCSNLKEINFPIGLTNIGAGAFRKCINLKSLYLPSTTENISDAFDTSPTVTVPNNCKTEYRSWEYPNIYKYNLDTNTAILYSVSIDETSFDVPEKIYDYPVTKINSSAFSGCNRLTNVSIPESVTSIGYSTFKDCTSLVNIKLPDRITKIEFSSFENCSSLNSIVIPQSVNEIEYKAFKGCSSLTNIEIPSGVSQIGINTFENCTNLNKIIIPKSTIKIYDNAFIGCDNLTIYGYSSSYAETYANQHSIPFIALDSSTEESIATLINNSEYGDEIYIDMGKYGSILSPIDIASAKAKDLTLILQNANYSWKIKASDIISDESIDYNLLMPCTEWCPVNFDISFDDNISFTTKSSSNATLIYKTSEQNSGKYANIFALSDGVLNYCNSVTIDEDGSFSFIPTSNSSYYIAISTNVISELRECFKIHYNKPDCIIVTRGDEVLADNSTIHNGDILIIKARSLDGYELRAIKLNSIDIVDGCSYTVSNYDITIDVVYEKITSDSEPHNSFITVIPDGVIVTRNNIPISVETLLDQGDVIKITAEDRPGFILKYLKVNGVPIANGSSYTVGNEDVVIEVYYEKIGSVSEPTIVKLASIPDGITVTKSGSIVRNGDALNEGDVIRITAEDRSGYRIEYLKVNGLSIANGGTYTVGKENIYVEVKYEWIGDNTKPADDHVFIRYIADNVVIYKDNTIVKSGGTLSKGDVIIITAEERSGYRLVSLKVNDREIRNGERYTVGNEDLYIIADYVRIDDQSTAPVQPVAPLYPVPDYPYIPIVSPPSAPTPSNPDVIIPSPQVEPEIANIPVIQDEISPGEIELSLKCSLSKTNGGKAVMRTNRKFFYNSAQVRIKATNSSAKAGKSAGKELGEDYISYPFDISIYDSVTGKKTSIKEGGYITFELPIPQKISSYMDDVNVWHIADGKPELVSSSVITDEHGYQKIRFTAYEFSPYMITAVKPAESGEDISSNAGVADSPIHTEIPSSPVSNGVRIPSCPFPSLKRLSNKRRRFRILRKRRKQDVVFIY